MIEEQEDEVMLSLFLDFLTNQALSNSETELEVYTEEMDAEDEELIADVKLDN